MKTQIIKIIPCILAGFILSACVGAVNLAEGAVENIKNNTKEEPIVLDPEAVLINRCIIDDNLKDSSCAPIVDDKPCIRDPFGVACDITFTDYYKTAQANRISFCRENINNNLCIKAIENVCVANPFDTLCDGLATHFPARKTICTSERDSDRCVPIIARVCRKNSLDDVCAGNPKYYSEQKYDCTYDNSNSPLCNSIIRRVCEANPFDVLCAGKTAYYPAQRAACERDKASIFYSIKDRCAPVIARACEASASDTLCRASNLKFSDFPERPHKGFEPTPGSATGSCYRENKCYGRYPVNIDIKPLQDNSGKAIYTGDLLVFYGGVIHKEQLYHRKEIDIEVNFDNSRLTYSGDISGTGEDARLFNINGGFTARGQITGYVDFRSVSAPLIGLIGQTEMTGVFAEERGGFAGGFTATREE